ncbi:MAG: amidase [Rhodospirillaceae bacterium]|nr:amidase [Rhodospirillaceae bacterium]
MAARGEKTGLEQLSVREGAKRIAAGEITSEALVQACLDRIAAREGEVGAWAFLDPEAAIAQAQAADRGSARGPLHGVPIAIKDIIDTVDMPTAHGSPIYTGNRPAWDAAPVALLREAGAVILGKTVTTEFAAVTPGKTRNPHDTARTPGGSSSGSAAAVADFMVPAALGTQTVGSTIRPASYCGAVGFKPTYQALSLAGVKQQAESLDTLGIIARTVDDVHLLGRILAGDTPGPVLPKRAAPPRLAFCRTPHWPKAEPAMVKAMEEAKRLFAGAGAWIEEHELSPRFAEALDAQWTILRFEFARVLTFERTQRREQLSERLRNLLDEGMKIGSDEHRAAQALAHACRAEIAPLFDRFDAILTPAAAGEAPDGLQSPSDLLFQRLWTLLHLPAITLPGLEGPNELPLGVQLVGRHDGDAALLGVAAWAEPILAGSRQR